MLSLVSLYSMQIRTETSYPELERHFFSSLVEERDKSWTKKNLSPAGVAIIAFIFYYIRCRATRLEASECCNDCVWAAPAVDAATDTRTHTEASGKRSGGGGGAGTTINAAWFGRGKYVWKLKVDIQIPRLRGEKKKAWWPPWPDCWCVLTGQLYPEAQADAVKQLSEENDHRAAFRCLWTITSG